MAAKPKAVVSPTEAIVTGLPVEAPKVEVEIPAPPVALTPAAKTWTFADNANNLFRELKLPDGSTFSFRGKNPFVTEDEVLAKKIISVANNYGLLFHQ